MQTRTVAFQPVHAGAKQPDRTPLAGTDRSEAGTEEHVLVDLKVVGVQSGTSVVVQVRPTTLQEREVGAV